MLSNMIHGGYHLEMKGISNAYAQYAKFDVGGYHLEMKGISNLACTHFIFFSVVIILK